MPVRRHPVTASLSTTPLACIPLDEMLVARLRSTYTRLRVHDHTLASAFYSKLFAAAPQVRSMFRSDPATQAAKLMAALDAVVQNLERPTETAAMLADLGRRHAGYGAKPEHYDLVVTLLVESMQDVLGLGSDDPAIREWRMALRLIADQMIAASGSASAARSTQDR